MIYLGKKMFNLNNSENKSLATQNEAESLQTKSVGTYLVCSNRSEKIEILINSKTNYRN